MAGICWHCGGRLMKTHEIVSDQIGLAHKVHKSCKKEAQASVSVVTAQATADRGAIGGDFQGWLD